MKTIMKVISICIIILIFILLMFSIRYNPFYVFGERLHKIILGGVADISLITMLKYALKTSLIAIGLFILLIIAIKAWKHK